MNWGQNYLSQISDETGGESYYLGFGAPVSFVPYLDDLTHRLTRQYLLTFLAKPEKSWFPTGQASYRSAECGVGRGRQSLRASRNVAAQSSDHLVSHICPERESFPPTSPTSPPARSGPRRLRNENNWPNCPVNQYKFPLPRCTQRSRFRSTFGCFEWQQKSFSFSSQLMRSRRHSRTDDAITGA